MRGKGIPARWKPGKSCPSSQILARIPLHSGREGNAFLSLSSARSLLRLSIRRSFLELMPAKKTRAVESANIKVSGSPAPEEVPCLALAEGLAKEPDPMNFAGCLIALALADTLFEDRPLVDLPVVTAGLLLEAGCPESFCLEMPCEAERIRTMRSGNPKCHTGVLCERTAGVAYLLLWTG